MKQYDGARFPVKTGRSRIDGTGLFAAARIPARAKVGELSGEIISLAEARRRAKKLERIAIVEFPEGGALDASGGNDFRFVNHSCAGNLYIRLFKQHVEFYAKRPIRAGEELTCDYGETQHEGTLPCRCGAPGCRDFL
jgi:SET domain-containing protein